MKTCSLIILALLFNLCAFAGEKKEDVQTYEGTLKTGIMSIGGETTGATLTTGKGVVYEVDFSKNAELAKLADSLSGKHVVVTGEMETVKGVETGERHVIEVTALKEAAK